MKDKIIMDNPDKLKITLTRYWRINFRYNNKLYSLQECCEDSEYFVDFKIFKEGKWEYITSVEYMDIYDMHIIKYKFERSFYINNIIYKHIDKYHFLKTLHKFGLIDAGDIVELE